MTFDDLFALAEAGHGWTAPGAPPTDETRPFGGLLLGQAIVAASAFTRRCHALHALFIGQGVSQLPFDVSVDRTRDGGSFTTRRVEISQRGRLLLAAYSSHHDGDAGPEHQAAMPVLPGPESLEDQRVTRAARAEQRGKPAPRILAEAMLDARPVELPPGSDGVEGRRAVWFRPRQAIRGGPDIHQAVIAFASDMGLVRVGLQVHNTRGDGGPLQVASLDHAIWFHGDARADDWMLHVQRSPVAAHGRGLSQASIFTRNGKLVASAAQEFLARRRRDQHHPDRGEAHGD